MTTATTEFNLTNTLRTHFNNNEVEICDSEVHLPSTNQTMGLILEGEDTVIEHLRTLCIDQGNEWNGVDAADLYNAPGELRQGLTLIDADEEIWFQSYR